MLKLFSGIGFSYNSERKTLSEIAVIYIKEKKLLSEKRKVIAEKIKEFKKIGLKFSEVRKHINCIDVNERFVKRHYYESAGQRISLDFISFKDFVSEKKKEFAILTNEISKATFGKTVDEYKKHKGLQMENLRDHMDDLELIFININS